MAKELVQDPQELTPEELELRRQAQQELLSRSGTAPSATRDAMLEQVAAQNPQIADEMRSQKSTTGEAAAPTLESAPEVTGLKPIGKVTGGETIGAAPTKLPNLSFKEREALPLTSPGARFGSSGYWENVGERALDQQQNPLGSAENHPGTLGKIGHVLGKIGNIAGNAIAPGIMESTPGTEAYRQKQLETATKEIGPAETREETKRHALEAEKEAERNADIKENRAEKPQSAAGLAALARQGYKIGPDGSIVALDEHELSPEARANRQLQDATIGLREAQKELALAGNDPTSPKYKLAKAKIDVESQRINQAGEALGLHQQQFENKKEEQGIIKPSGQAQSRGSAAQAVMDMIPDLKGLVEKNRGQMGPIMGRINRGEIAIGDVDPEIARLYSAMKSFYALQPAVHGFRNAEFVKDFETALGTLERNPDAFLAGMEGLKPTLQSVAKEGKTFHKRIVEGQEGETAGGAKGGGHSFTINGTQYNNVPDDLYEKAKQRKGFKE